ncbi:YxiG-like protein [Nonomuraea harbinensis]|uniref:YxiG-like protein n=1 Tax=Nonomuraea harbinensis TaxID=1286938 RepID=UPI003FD7D56C
MSTGRRFIPAPRSSPTHPPPAAGPAAIGIDFHEVRIETNVHDLTLVFSDLTIEELPPPSPGHRHGCPVQ